MIYGNLHYVNRMYYMNADLYRYAIGREGQSVQEDVMKKRYPHQIRSTLLCFTAFHLDEITQKRKCAYLRHELFIMFGISILFARLNRTEEADHAIEKMWEDCRAFDAKWADYFRYHTALRFICLPGRAGGDVVRMIYLLAHRVVRFN